MDGPWRIRPARRADGPAIAAAEAECFTDPWSADGLDELLAAPHTLGLVGEDRDGVLAGYLIARVVVDEAEILNIAVRPPYRGCGLGARLLDDGLRASAARGAEAAFLEVRESNRVARGLYERRGFRVVGIRIGYYRSPRENGVAYRRDLVRASE